MKILFFGELPPFSSNGISRANNYYITVLRRHSYVVKTVIDYPSGLPLKVFHVLISIVKFVFFGLYLPRPFVTYMTLSQSLFGLFKCTVFAIISLIFNAKIAIHLHRGDLLLSDYGIRSALIRFIFSNSDIVFCISHGQRSELEKISAGLREKSVYCPNPFPHLNQLLSVFRDKKNLNLNKPRMLYVGPLIKSKGVPNLLSQYLYYCNSVSSSSIAPLTLAGRASDTLIKRRILMLEKNQLLTHLSPPSFSDVIPLIASHDIFILPSISEGMPYLAIEALLAGLYVFVSKVGYIVEVFGEAYPLYIDPLERTSLSLLLRRLGQLSSDDVMALGRARQSALDYVEFDSGQVFIGQLRSVFN